MFGFVVGTLSLLGFIKVWRWGRGPFNSRRWMLRRLFERLDTTPGQERVLSAAVEEVQRAAWRARGHFSKTRGAVAAAIRGDTLDSAAVDAAFAEQQAAFDEVRKAIREGLQSVHEALTPEQRGRLGDLIEFGPRHARLACAGTRCRGEWGSSAAGA